jgi:hypothetical protein
MRLPAPPTSKFLGNRPTNGQFNHLRRLPSTSATDSPLLAFGFDRLNRMNLLL